MESGYRQRSTQNKKKLKDAERSIQVVDAVHYYQRSLAKVLTDGEVSYWHKMKKSEQKRANTCTACTSSGESFKCQMPAAETLNSYKISEPDQEIQTDAS